MRDPEAHCDADGFKVDDEVADAVEDCNSVNVWVRSLVWECVGVRMRVYDVSVGSSVRDNVMRAQLLALSLYLLLNDT